MTPLPKPRQPRHHPESTLQTSCVLWFDYQYAQLKTLLYANANGGQRSPKEAAIMQGEGVRKGVPDLFLAIPRGDWHGLYIEMKVLPNQPTIDQRKMMEALTQQGYYCQVIYSSEQFTELVNNYLNL